jgi:hypothetical protein
MHLLGTVYIQFYGGFMQAFQFATNVARVTGNPVKDGFQAHHLFAKKMFNACNRLLLLMQKFK